MTYEQFMAEVAGRGLRAEQCHYNHWQILGGTKHPIVNVWAHTKRGFRYQTDGGKGKSGTLMDAIALAGEKPASDPPPWNESKPEQPQTVGLIRRVWRWVW